MNNLQMIGNISTDITLKYSKDGMAIASFNVAWNKRKKNGEKEAHFFTCKAFARSAEL